MLWARLPHSQQQEGQARLILFQNSTALGARLPPWVPQSFPGNCSLQLSLMPALDLGPLENLYPITK